jgi:glycosyltransferase involved in cell wall biosynthesis
MRQSRNFNFRLLSVIIPAFQQEKTILKDLKNIKKTLDNLGTKYEIIVVVDGNVDNTMEKLRGLGSSFVVPRNSKVQKPTSKIHELKSKNLRVIYYAKNQGKGHAVRVGMLAAKGDVIGFIDAGMDIHPAGFKMLLQHMEWYGADVIVGSKLHPVSKVRYPLYRKVLSRGYRLITRLLFGFSVRDTQVGLKFFKRKVVRDVLPRLLVKKYAFDIEILAVSYLLGYKKIYEAPVEISFKENNISKKGLPRVIFLMLWDTAAVFYRIKLLNYYKKKKVVFKVRKVGKVLK